MSDDLGRGLVPGDKHHRAYVGPPRNYDLMAASQFSLLTHLGLREGHSLLDVGCGSLRAGRLLIVYLLPGRYHGIEPNDWLVQEGIDRELGRDVIALKQPRFSDVEDFRLTVFERAFDYVLAQSIFSHAAPAQIERCLEQTARVLEPAGVLAATWMPGEEDHTGDEWVYPGAARYREPTIRRMVEAAGLEYTALGWPHPKGQRWFAATRPGAVDVSGADLSGFVGLRAKVAEQQAALERIGRSLPYRLYRGFRRATRRTPPQGPRP